MQRAFKRFHTTLDAPRLTRFFLSAPKNVEVEFANGSKFSLSAEFLRIHSPAADGKIRSIGGEKKMRTRSRALWPFTNRRFHVRVQTPVVIFGRRYVGIMSAEPVGNYGVRIVFDDLHKTGIYSWDYFYHLGTNKFALMRDYIRTLQKHGLSRDPTRKK